VVGVTVAALEEEIVQQADRIAWLEGDVAGWRIENQRLRDAENIALARIEQLKGERDEARAALDGTPSEDTQ
jgi:hypothetical protein